ncbi:hypothetical protein [Clostridium sp.]|jgi:hypothetical protein|uniref:hypothetical protein n=1 Tax=Clostridium sp. TaxID=1506 RepID=UPI0039F5CFA9
MNKYRTGTRLMYLLMFFVLLCCSYIITSSLYSFLTSIFIVTLYILLSTFLFNRNVVKGYKEYLGAQVVLTLIYWMIIGKTLIEDMSFNEILFFIIIMITPYFSKMNYEKRQQ